MLTPASCIAVSRLPLSTACASACWAAAWAAGVPVSPIAIDTPPFDASPACTWGSHMSQHVEGTSDKLRWWKQVRAGCEHGHSLY